MKILTISLLLIASISFAQYAPPGLVNPNIDVTLQQDLTVIGHVVEKNCRAFAFLTASSNTVVTNVPPYYAPVAGVFSNVAISGFGLLAAYTNLNGNVNPAIVYTNGIDDYYEIIITAQASAPDNGTTIYVGASLNGVTGNGDVMAGFIKTGDDKINLSVNTCHMLTNGAVIQLVCGSSAGTDGKVVTFDKFNTSIKRLR